MSEDLFGRSIKEQIEAEIKEKADVTDDEYKQALRYFGLTPESTEKDWKNAHRTKVKEYREDPKELQIINDMNSIIQKHYKHIRWKEDVRTKKAEIAAKMEQMLIELSKSPNITTPPNNLKKVYLKYYSKINFVNTIVGLDRLYELYLEELRNGSILSRTSPNSNSQELNNTKKNQNGIYVMDPRYIPAQQVSTEPLAFYLYDETKGILFEIKNGEITREMKITEDIIFDSFIPIEKILLNSKKYRRDSYISFMDDTEYFSNGHYRLTKTKANLYDENYTYLLHYGNHWLQSLTSSNEIIDSNQIIEDLKKYLESCIKRTRKNFTTR